MDRPNSSTTPRAEILVYASAFWHCEPQLEAGHVNVTIGWSFPLVMATEYGSIEYRSGATKFRSRCIAAGPRQEGLLPFVEEPLGVLYAKPTKAEEEWNAHCERLVADYLLFFVHRVLFGQSRQNWPEVRGSPDILDNVLVFGPALPKFRGRICYSHFRREKTVAVLAPDCIPGRPPAQGPGTWDTEPYPSFWHDCSVRRWALLPGKGPSDQNQRLNSFDLLVPTGDGISGRLTAGLPYGAVMWRQKAEKIQQLLDTDRKGTRFALWENKEVFLPRGMARAVRAAALGDALQKALNQKADLLQRAGSDKSFYQELGDKIQDEGNVLGPDDELPGIRALVFCRAVVIRNRNKTSTRPTLAARDMRSEKCVAEAISELKEAFGDYLFSK